MEMWILESSFKGSPRNQAKPVPEEDHIKRRKLTPDGIAAECQHRDTQSSECPDRLPRRLEKSQYLASQPFLYVIITTQTEDVLWTRFINEEKLRKNKCLI